MAFLMSNLHKLKRQNFLRNEINRCVIFRFQNLIVVNLMVAVRLFTKSLMYNPLNVKWFLTRNN